MRNVTRTFALCLDICLAGANPTIAQPPPAHNLVIQLRQSATREFAYGIHLKPDANALSGRARELAPLIVREVVADADMPQVPPYFSGGCDVRWFAFPHWLEGHMSDWRHAFSMESSVVIGGVEHEQIAFVWTLESKTPKIQSAAAKSESRHQHEPTTLGVRIALGLDGFPVVWEVLDSRIQHRVLYVSRSAEYLARQQFGDPLPGRQFAMERAQTETPDVIVIRALEDGPVPMGPYLYVDGANQIVNVLCRCSAAQVNQFVKEGTYQVQPIAENKEAFAKALRTWDMSEALRWPQGL